MVVSYKCSMELPEQNHPYLFSQMLQMFPHIPHNIVQVYTMQYANDAEMCAQMLNLQSNKYKEIKNDGHLQHPLITEESSNLDSSLSETPALDANDNLNILSTAPKNISVGFPVQTNHNHDVENWENTSSNSDNIQLIYLNSGNAYDNSKLLSNVNDSSTLEQQFYPDEKSGDHSELSVPGPCGHCIPVSHELHINVDDNDGSLHSWRPNLSNSLSSDFFLPQPVVNINPGLEYSRILKSAVKPHNNSFTSGASNSTEVSHHQKRNNGQPYVYSLGDVNFASDIEKHLHLQKVQMNTIKYEVINAKIELGKLREAVEIASQELSTSLQSRQTQDMEKLNEENARLRLECQCLCLEVDYHLKGAGPLGEIDEDFYKNKSISSVGRSGFVEVRRPSIEAELSDRDFDESRKWECTKCTFANHPAIVSCEMCHSPRQRFQNYIIHQSSPNTCYCHRNENSQLSS